MKKTLWQEYFEKTVKEHPFVIYDSTWDINAPETQAHLSLEAYLNYYCYKSNGAEVWTILSMVLKPAVIVELGTAFGIRTCMLGKLNPKAKIYSTDNQKFQSLGANIEMGYLAKLHNIPFIFYCGNSWDTPIEEKLNFCYIDADHSEEAVYKDSWWAWNHKDENNYLLCWDDYPLDTVKKAVDRFCKEISTDLKFIRGIPYVSNIDIDEDYSKLEKEQ